MNRFENIDCMIGMKEYSDNYFDLAIVDPPYGIGIKTNMKIRTTRRPNSLWSEPKHKEKEWDNNKPDKSYFDELFRVSKNQIVCGGNYLCDLLPVSGCWIFWDKLMAAEMLFADGEFIWTSFKHSSKKFVCHPFVGSNGGKDRIHPTQKPKGLYAWLLNTFAKEGDIILDTHVGSASSLIACEDMGFEYVGFELDEDYYNAAQKRLTQFRSQLKLAI